MNLFGTVRRIWAHGDDEEEENDRDFIDAENDELEPDYNRGSSASQYSGYSSDSGYDSPSYSNSGKYASSAYPAGRSSYSTPPASSGANLGASVGGSSSAAGRMRSVNPTLRAREKNIYTIKPKRLDEATVAADCLKTGSAVIVNLESVDRVTAVRIVDFMSGVCYGIDGAQGQPGHAMKLGEMIFLFTPAEFEITSDETDYAANNESFFRDMIDAQTAPSAAVSHGAHISSPASAPAPQAGGSSFASSYNTPNYGAERRPWE